MGAFRFEAAARTKGDLDAASQRSEVRSQRSEARGWKRREGGGGDGGGALRRVAGCFRWAQLDPAVQCVSRGLFHCANTIWKHGDGISACLWRLDPAV